MPGSRAGRRSDDRRTMPLEISLRDLWKREWSCSREIAHRKLLHTAPAPLLKRKALFEVPPTVRCHEWQSLAPVAALWRPVVGRSCVKQEARAKRAAAHPRLSLGRPVGEQKIERLR